MKFLIMLLLWTILAHAQESKPNIILVLADDVGLGDIAFYHRQRTGAKEVVPTPNLDRLISDGMRFDNAFSPASLCAPSRFSMLTGNYPFRNYKNFGVWHPYDPTGVEPNFTTSARIAKATGYRTAFLGKWGLGGSMYKKASQEIYQEKDFNFKNNLDKIDFTRVRGPNYLGFDYSCSLPEGIQNTPFAFYENEQWMPLKKDSELKVISAVQTAYNKAHKHKNRGGMGDSNWDPRDAGRILVDKAVQFIDEHHQFHSDKPFFMYYCASAVHIPHTPPESLKGIKIAGSTPGHHGDMIRELDVQIGLLRAVLKKNGLGENTLFIFTSDNGGLKRNKKMLSAGHDSSNGFRAVKGSIYEGGHRVPFIATWPGEIAPNSHSLELIIAHDVVATLTAITAQSLNREQVLDSKNLLPLLRNETQARGHKYILNQSEEADKSAYYSIQDNKWKLIMETPNRFKKDQVSILKAKALFRLSNNPLEREEENLINNPEYHTVVQGLFKQYSRFRKTEESTMSNDYDQ